MIEMEEEIPYMTHNEYRQTIRRVSRHAQLLGKTRERGKLTMPREQWIALVRRVEKRVAAIIEEIDENSGSFIDRQIAYDEERGAYDNEVFLSKALARLGYEVPESLEEMRALYSFHRSVVHSLTEGGEEE